MPVRIPEPEDLPACVAVLLASATDSAVAHGLQPVLDVVVGSRPAIAVYEQAGLPSPRRG